MKVNITTLLPANKENFKVFKIDDSSTAKLEFKYESVGYKIIYANNLLGLYETQNRDKLILDYFEALAQYNNCDTKEIKKRLDSLVENESSILHHQYQTSYKSNELKYLLGLENNIIRLACIEQKITYQQLADAIGVSESSLRSSVSTNKISKQIEKSIEMYLTIAHMKQELAEANAIKSTLKSWLS